ncbi:MAG: hypothetical protein IKC01_07980 [Clostridia bacterium]|nr:hypothetical protein [Clostridia bacterium]
MKRIFITLIFTIFIFLSFSVYACAGNGDIDSYKDEFSYEEMISEIDSATVEILNEIGITDISYESIFSVTPKKVFDSFFRVLTDSLKEPFKYFVSLVGLMAVMALFTNLSHSPETVTLIGTSCVACVLAVPVISLVSDSFSVLQVMSGFTSAFTGVFCAVVSAAGGVISGSAYFGLNISINSVLNVLLSSLSQPLTNTMCSLAFLSCFNIKSFSERISDLFKKAYIFLLGITTTVFSGVSALKTVLGSSADSVAIRGVKFLVGHSLPIVGGVVSESYQSILASLVLIKNTVGVFGIITVAVIVLPIVSELLVWCFCLNFISTVAEIFGCFKIENLISVFKDVIILLIATIVFSALLFIISCGMMLIFKGGI